MAARPNTDDEIGFLRDCADVLEAIKGLKARADRCGFTLPQSIARFVGTDSQAHSASISLRPVPDVGVPKEVGPDCFWAPASKAETKTLVRAILAVSSPLGVRNLHKEIGQYQKISAGSLANVGTQMQKAKEIERDDQGWTLVRREKAPTLHKGWLFGLPEVFGSYDIAWFRRAVIKKLLEQWRSGLQPSQIVEQLGALPWLTCPREKEIVKSDLEALRLAKEVKRVSHSGKWVLTEVPA